jgi:hypothetical protein
MDHEADIARSAVRWLDALARRFESVRTGPATLER